MRRVVVVTFALLVFGLCCVVCAQVDDSQKGRAKKHFDAGKALMKVEDFPGAASEFEESVRLLPTKNGLFNLANCYKGWGRYDKALETYKRLDMEFGAQLEEFAVAKMEEDIRDIKALIAWLTVEVSLSGATVAVDGIERGESPIKGPLMVGGGSHEVEVVLEGYEKSSQEVSILAGERKSLSIELVLLPEPEPDPEPILEPEPVEKGRSGLFKGGVVSLGMGAAILIAGSVTGGMAFSMGKDLKKECDNDECPPPWHDKMNKMDNLAVTTNVLLGVGGVAAVAGLTMLIVDAKRNKEDEEPLDVTISPIAGPSLAGAMIAVRF